MFGTIRAHAWVKVAGGALTGKKRQADNKKDNRDAAHQEAACETALSLPPLPDRIEKQDHRADDQQHSNGFLIHRLTSSR